MKAITVEPHKREAMQLSTFTSCTVAAWISSCEPITVL